MKNNLKFDILKFIKSNKNQLPNGNFLFVQPYSIVLKSYISL